MIKAVIFDIHGVITHGSFAPVYATVADKLGISHDTMNNYHKDNLPRLLTGEISFKDQLSELGAPQDLAEIDVLRMWSEAIKRLWDVDEEMLDLIKSLRTNHKVAALTNLSYERRYADEEMGLYSHFDCVITSVDEGVKKPDPRIFNIALKRLDISAPEAIFIDDQQKNVLAAEQLGMNAICFSGIDSLRKDLSKFETGIKSTDLP